MFVLKQNLMQGYWHYLKGLIYYRPIFRLTILAFLRARAIPRENIFYLCFACFLLAGSITERLQKNYYIHLKISVLITNDHKFVLPASLCHPQSLPHASSDDVSAESFNLRELSEAFGR